MNTSVERLTPKIGRLFRLKSKIDKLDFEPGDIFLLVSVKALTPADLNLPAEESEIFQAKIFAHYPDAVVCQFLCGEKEHLHASASWPYFVDYFDEIVGV